jgi:hypothetical protein
MRQTNPARLKTRQMLIDAYTDGNVQDYARLIREYERLARMGGLSQKF